jgi:hypothetical protein
MDRTSFFNIVDIGNGPEYDHLNNTLNRFTMNYPVLYYRIMADDVLRPDLISYKSYQSVKFWWIICFVNKIQDPLTDITPGDLIKIPSILDIYAFYKKYTFR